MLAAAGISALAACAAAAPANAAQLTQTYKCTYPLIGERGLTVNIDAAIPDAWPTNSPTPAFDIAANAEADLGTYQGLDLIGANKISGTSKATSTVTAPNFTLPVQVPIAIPEVTKPAAPPLRFEGLTGETPSLTFTQAGNVNITVDKLDLNITAQRADGSFIVLPPVVPVDSDGNPNTFDVPCVLDPAGQNKTLQNIAVGPVVDDEAPTAPGEPFITSFDDVTPTSINLQWGASTDNEGVAGYEIRYEGETVEVGNVTQFLLEGLEPEGLYEIDVRAFDAAGNYSEYSPAIVIELPAEGTDEDPSAPGTLSGNATSETSVQLSWGAATDDVFVAGYEIFQDGVKVKEVTAANLTTTIDGLTRATNYQFKVRALDAPALKPGPFSNEITVRTQGNNPPSKPANLAGTPTLTSVALTWDASTDDDGVTGYDVFQDGVKIDTVTGTSKTVTGLTSSTTYAFTVQAIDTNDATSDLSDEVEVTTLTDQPPSKPAGLEGTPTKTSVELSWSASTDDVAVAGYDVYQDGVKIDTVTGTSKTVTGLTQETAYEFTVQAVDSAGQTSDASDAVTVTTLGDNPPSAPTGLAGTPTTNSVALSWTASTDDEGVAGYDVYQDGVKIDTVTGTSKTVTGLTPNTAYAFKVQAVDTSDQTSDFSSEITVTTADDSTVAYSYGIKGFSNLKNLSKGTVPLSGGIDAELELATGNYTADLTLNKTRARLQVLGLIPVTADIAFAQSGQTVGSLKSGVLTATARFKIKLPKVYLFGVLPIAGSDSCETKSSSIASMKSSGAFFDPLQGGKLTGTYGISDLKGCGWLNDLISPLTKGGGNTIDIDLTPAS